MVVTYLRIFIVGSTEPYLTQFTTTPDKITLKDAKTEIFKIIKEDDCYNYLFAYYHEKLG